MSKLSRGGSCFAVTLGLCVLACRPAQRESSSPRDGARTDGSAARGGEVSHAAGDPGPGPASADPHTSAADGHETARLGPIRREAAFVFTPHAGTVKLGRLAKTVRAATVAASPELRVELGCPDGARLVDAGKARRLPLGDEVADAAVVDPDARWIAVALGTGRVSAFARAPSRRLGTWTGRDPIALASDTLVLRDECRWIAVDPGQPALAPRVLAENLCGDVLHVDRTARTIAIAETAVQGDAAAVRAVVQVGTDAVQRVDLPGDPAMTSAAMSADGTILCGLFAIAGKSVLQCRSGAGSFEKVATGVLAPLRFASDAPRLAFTAREHGGAIELHVADFEQRFVRSLGRVHQRRFAFLPGAERLVAFEGARGVVFQLDSGFVVPFGTREDDWVGVVALPGTHDAFLATRLRSRCAELMRVDLPATP